MESYDSEYGTLQQSMKQILQKEDDLQEIVQLVGKDSLSEDQKVTLEVARIIREDFLQQNGFTDYDFFCPLAKTIGMMKVICGFHDAAQKVIAESSGEHKITSRLRCLFVFNRCFPTGAGRPVLHCPWQCSLSCLMSLKHFTTDAQLSKDRLRQA